MQNLHLKVQIASRGVVKDLNYKTKCESVHFCEYDTLVSIILGEFKNKRDYNDFIFNIYNLCDNIKVSTYSNGFRLYSDPYIVSISSLAYCLPRYIRNKYFEFDCLRQKYYLAGDLYYHIV